MNHLPVELINTILEFQGYHVFRNGKFMKQIPKTDERYSVLESKPQIKTSISWIEPNPTEYHVSFRKTINNLKYEYDISVIVLDSMDIRWIMYVKERQSEKPMIGSQWGMCRSKCASFRLPV